MTTLADGDEWLHDVDGAHVQPTAETLDDPRVGAWLAHLNEHIVADLNPGPERPAETE